MNKLAIIGRILFALPFGVMGVNHFLMKNYFLGLMSSFIPGGGFTILLTGFILILACVLIIMNKFLKTVCYSLAGLLFIFIVTIHIPGLSEANWQVAFIELLKDTSLMGGAIMIALYSDTLKELSSSKSKQKK